MLFSVFHTVIAQASDMTADNVINLVNKARINVDEAVLVKNELLQKAAEKKAQDMIDNDYFAHVSPDGKDPWFWIESQGYDYRLAGENLAINYSNTKEQQKAWMDSPLHRKNILNADYREIGVAVKEGVIDGHKTNVAVQMFGVQFPAASVASAVSVKSEPPISKIVTAPAPLLQSNFSPRVATKIDIKKLYNDNKVAFTAWLVAIVVAIIIAVLDVLALFHKKHPQLFILRSARNRHT